MKSLLTIKGNPVARFIISVTFTMCVAGISLSAAAKHTAPTQGPAYSVIQSTATAPAPNPPTPRKVTFAGQTFDMDRIDKYERLDREITQMTYAHASTLLMLKRANRVFPIIAPILKANGVPVDMIYLAAIESTLNPRAYSGAKAAGIWQFMPATARQYGLQVDDDVDERYNLEKSTAAAAAYLRQAYAKYGNWETAMASYNAGQGRLSAETEAQLEPSAFDLYLVEETQRYPYRVLAAKVIMENPRKYGFHLLADQFYPPYPTRDVTVTQTIDNLPQWAKDRGTNYATLRELNPWLRSKTLPVASGKSYTVKLPDGSWKKTDNKITKKMLYNPDWAE